MNAKKFSEALGNVREDYVNEAAAYRRGSKSLSWVKWGAAAACLCLVAAGSGVLIHRNINKPINSNESDQIAHGLDTGDENIGGWAGGETGGGLTFNGAVRYPGLFPDGDTGHYSMAVIPASEKFENVASAHTDSLTEDDLSGIDLAKHLPKQLPDGFHFGRGSLYTTVMKDGTTYNMLHIQYITGTIPEQKFTEDGGAIMPDPWTIGDQFTVRVWSFELNTKHEIYSSAEEVPLSLLEEDGTALIRSGDCIVSVYDIISAESAAVLESLKTIE